MRTMRFDNVYYPVHEHTYQYAAGKQYQPPTPSGVSIEDLLGQDSRQLADQVVNAAFCIVYRLRISDDIRKALDYSDCKLSSELMQLEGWLPGTNMNVERRKSMLQKELHAMQRLKLEEKLNCWKDLARPAQYFVDLFHQSQQLRHEQKVLKP